MTKQYINKQQSEDKPLSFIELLNKIKIKIKLPIVARNMNSTTTTTTTTTTRNPPL